MTTFIGNGKRLSDRNSVDFSLRVATEENMFGPRVMVVINMFNGNRKTEWMTVFDANEFVLRSPELGLSIKSAHIEYKGVFDEWGQSF